MNVMFDYVTLFKGKKLRNKRNNVKKGKYANESKWWRIKKYFLMVESEFARL